MNKSRTFMVCMEHVEINGNGLTRVPLVIRGRWAKGMAKFSITDADIAQIIRNFRGLPNRELVIDYEHASARPEVANGRPIPAAGWLKEIDDTPDVAGVLWGGVEFTEEARRMISSREYKYFSPVIVWGSRDGKGNAVGTALFSGALTNTPALKSMPAITLSEIGWNKETEEEQTMDEKKVIALSDVPRAKDGRLDFRAIPTGPDVVIASEVFAAQQTQSELDEAMQKGKITGAQRRYWEKIALSDIDSFRGIMATMKPQVDFSEHGFQGTVENDPLTAREETLDRLATTMMASDSSLSYGDAVRRVCSEKPHLSGAMRESR